MKIKNKCKKIMRFSIIFILFIMFETKVEASELTQINQTTNSVTIQWNPVNDAGEYYIGIGNDKQEALKAVEEKPIIVPNNKTSYTLKNLKSGTNYYVYLKYKFISEYYETIKNVDQVEIVTLPTKVTGLNQSKWWYYIKKVDFKWNDQRAADYEVKFMNSSGKKIKKLKANGNQASYKVKNNKIYKVKVRAYVTIHNKRFYGDWSNTAYLFTQPMIKSIKVQGGKLKLSWEKISGATSYSIYISKNEKRNYKKVKTVGSSKNTYQIYKFQGKKFYKKKVYYVYIVANKKIGKKTYTSGKHYTEEVCGNNHNLRWSFDEEE